MITGNLKRIARPANTFDTFEILMDSPNDEIIELCRTSPRDGCAATNFAVKYDMSAYFNTHVRAKVSRGLCISS